MNEKTIDLDVNLLNSQIESLVTVINYESTSAGDKEALEGILDLLCELPGKPGQIVILQTI